MRLCFYLAGLGLAGLAANGADTSDMFRRASSVVRADPRTGHLVRATVVAPRVVREKVVKPREPEKSGAAAQQAVVSLGDYIAHTAERYEVDPLLVHSVIEVESNYNPFALSSKGAEGIMQLMPGTARRFQVKDSFNPWQNIDGGVRYLKHLLGLFNSERLALAAYNAGEAAVFKYGNIPPYPETNQYVYKVGKKLGAARRAAQSSEASKTRPAGTGDHPKIEHFKDAEGRDHYRTRSAP